MAIKGLNYGPETDSTKGLNLRKFSSPLPRAGRGVRIAILDCYDRLEATAPHRIHSLAPWRHQRSGHPHAYGSCVRRAGTVHAVIHSPQQAFSQQSSGAAASRSRSHSFATNNRAAWEAWRAVATSVYLRGS